MHESRMRLNSGTLPSRQVERLATSHAFVQQIDVVFSSRSAPDRSFTSLKTTYSTAQFTLSELYEYASRLPIPDVPFKALPIQRDADDTWCIDTRGILTLSVSKSHYEQLGLVGTKLPFKGCPERYAIRVPLKRETTSIAVQARHRAVLGIWDRARTAQGLGKWRVAYVGGITGPSTPGSGDDLEAHEVTHVTACMRCETDVYVPHVGDLVQSPDEDPEDHRERLDALFEWVGMACLGAQRLRANDRVDPYVAVYETPSPASIGEVTHLRWKGLMDGTFVRSVIDTAMHASIVSTSPHDSPFVAITLHSDLMAPVSYMPESKEAPPRVPSPEAEDTVCLLLSRASGKSTWAIAESIGKWDARWG